MELKFSIQDLRHMQKLSLDSKISMSYSRIMDFAQEMGGWNNCYVSYSGGKDSTVLLHLCRTLYPHMKAIFDDTGLEEPSVRKLANETPNCEVVRPTMSFYQVLTEVGYPVVSKEVAECVEQARLNLDNIESKKCSYRLQKMLGTAKNKDGSKSLYNKDKYKCLLNAPFLISSTCCSIMKKKPLKEVNLKPIIGTLAEESKNRTTAWQKTGCNSFSGKVASRPLSFWTNQDILEYIQMNNLKIADCYGEVFRCDGKGNPDLLGDRLALSGVPRTGCVYCLLGITQDTFNGGINRLEHLRQTQPQLFDYCMRGGAFDNEGLWKPKNGLGMAFVIEWLNRNLSKTLKSGKVSLYIKGVDLSSYKSNIDKAFQELAELEPTRKIWLSKS